ncbi:uncharacterized protein [Macrobrachium rosenbergii]|uniref:uncharacterized protein n=1 Tax=Macrobrachium rosenbergii TaxID=79674 RepID=UPI0034D6C73D
MGTATYNPTANGMVERVHRSLKAALMACCTDKRWREQLPWVLLGLCTAPKANGDASPADKVYGETLAVPGEFFPPSADSPNTHLPRLKELAQKFAPCHKTFTDRTTTYRRPTLDSCAYVFVRDLQRKDQPDLKVGMQQYAKALRYLPLQGGQGIRCDQPFDDPPQRPLALCQERSGTQQRSVLQD